MNKDQWVLIVFFILALNACLQATNVEPSTSSQEETPEKPIIKPKFLVQPTPDPTPEPTPQKSACEYEIDSLKSEADSLRERLRSESECYCYDYDPD
jgi:hypothetical protein